MTRIDVRTTAIKTAALGALASVAFLATCVDREAPEVVTTRSSAVACSSDLQDDPNNCGVCGRVCASNQACCNGACVARTVTTGPLARVGTVGTCSKLQYRSYANQGQSAAGNVLPDFSYAGYRGGGVKIPHAKVIETVSHAAGDDRARIQAAIDRVSALGRDAQGFRGAVFLKRGQYQLSSRLSIKASGVVLRGEGQGSDGTILFGTGTDTDEPLIEIRGGGGDETEVAGSRRTITSSPNPVGSRQLQVDSAGPFAAGDRVVVLRTPNQAWIDAIHMNAAGFKCPCTSDPACPTEVDLDTGAFCPAINGTCSHPWRPCEYEIKHFRTLVGVSGTTLTLDVPLVDTLETQYGSGVVYKISDSSGHIEQSGVERMRLDTNFASSTDEAHAKTGVLIYSANHSWVQKVTVLHVWFSAVDIEHDANYNTVEEVAHLDPISAVAGGKRYSFNIGRGTGNLFQRCFARQARHAFVTGRWVAGPNVWLDNLAVDKAETDIDDGPHHRWGTGELFDNIKTNTLRVQNRQDAGSGHGWSGAQIMFWNPEVTRNLVSDTPAGAMSWVVGAVGAQIDSPVTPAEASGMSESAGTHASPRSLYLQQLKDRLGTAAVNAVTTPEQRSGAVWTALAKWAGEGELFPDPTCATGIRSGPSCCAASCGTCGGTGCGDADGSGDSCCTNTIKDSLRSCLDYGPPCLMPDPTCSTGVASAEVCCLASCGACGGTSCDTRPGGGAGCCANTIKAAWRSCAEFPPPCIVSDPACSAGLPLSNACCAASCGTCGGTSCGSRPGGAGCCLRSIQDANLSCTNHGPPCELSDPTCLTGVASDDGGVCCAKSCGRCGGSGCGSLPGGSACCVSSIQSAGLSCADHEPPCVMP